MSSEPRRYTVTEIANAIVRTAEAREASWRPNPLRSSPWPGRYELWFDEAARRVFPFAPDLAELAAEGAKHGEAVDWARDWLKRNAG